MRHSRWIAVFGASAAVVMVGCGGGGVTIGTGASQGTGGQATHTLSTSADGGAGGEGGTTGSGTGGATTNSGAGGGPACDEGETKPCYSGAPGTVGIGPCMSGTQTCSGGALGPCAGEVTPTAETCNGLDDDCNGSADDPAPVTCGVGACAVTVPACTNGAPSSCTPLAPSTEVCDGVDNNCDGTLDEGCCTNGQTQPCYGGPASTQGIGVCTAGVQTCVGGAWAACVGEVTPTIDGCDGLDNDCDGTVDEGLGGAQCDTGLYGVCAVGTTSCVGGVPLCNPNTQPSAEVCDGLDNNCDGNVDEGDPGGGAQCSTGALGVCGAGAMSCVGGTLVCVTVNYPAVQDICGNGLDDDCNGQVDENLDVDGDGWGVCDGDCCDKPGACSQTPGLVNPGAYEVVGNQVNDDCDPTTSDTVPVADCSPGALQTPTTAINLAKAMELCQFTTQSPPLAQKKWGVITAQLLAADQVSAAPQDIQVGILSNFGPNVLPKKNSTMAALSSGTARDATDSGFVQPNGGWSGGGSANPPAAYLNAHGGVLQTKAGCPNGSGANDSVNLKLKVRAPSNAQSFSFHFKFYSAEYPEWVCTSYNDFFLALLTSQVAGIPADHNISFDSQHNPVSVNNGFFDVCSSCISGTNELVGTGMGGSGSTLTDGGGTVWLTTTSPVKPGEDIILEFVIWDTSDHAWDSTVLIDNFQWGLNPAIVGTIKG